MHPLKPFPLMLTRAALTGCGDKEEDTSEGGEDTATLTVENTAKAG